MNINVIELNGIGYISAIELQSELKSIGKFSTWIKRLIKRAFLIEKKDFVLSIKQSTGGRPFTDYLLSKEAAKRIAIVANTLKSKEIIDYLIELDRQKENLDLLTHDQVVYLTVLKTFFKYIENQKEYLEKHKNKFVSEFNKPYSNPYAEFNIWRNKILSIDKSELDEKIKEFCIENRKHIPALKTNHDKIRFLNEYDSLRNAVWDFLEIKGEYNSFKLAELVKRMAQAENLTVFNKNENDLFRQKEQIQLT